MSVTQRYAPYAWVRVGSIRARIYARYATIMPLSAVPVALNTGTRQRTAGAAPRASPPDPRAGCSVANPDRINSGLAGLALD